MEDGGGETRQGKNLVLRIWATCCYSFPQDPGCLSLCAPWVRHHRDYQEAVAHSLSGGRKGGRRKAGAEILVRVTELG